MKLKIHKNLQDYTEIDATRVLIEDSLGNPIALALDYSTENSPEMILAVTADSPGFNELLKQMGIHKVVAVTDLPQTPLNEVRFGAS